MKVTKKQQKEYLRFKLSNSKVWAEKALIKIYYEQTNDEQRQECTSEANGVGFTGTDGQILSSFADQVLRGRKLSEKQVAIMMNKMKKYWKQILKITDVEKLNEQILAL